MSFDPAGTSPGLQAQPAEEPKVINMKCRKADCTSIQVVEIHLPGVQSDRRLYRCCECGNIFGVSVGGSVSF